MVGETGSVRTAEELSVKALSFYLQSHKGFRAGEIVVEQFRAAARISHISYESARIGPSPSAVRQPAVQLDNIYDLLSLEEHEWRTH